VRNSHEASIPSERRLDGTDTAKECGGDAVRGLHAVEPVEPTLNAMACHSTPGNTSRSIVISVQTSKRHFDALSPVDPSTRRDTALSFVPTNADWPSFPLGSKYT